MPPCSTMQRRGWAGRCAGPTQAKASRPSRRKRPLHGSRVKIMRNYKHIEVRPISGALGAEIAGVDMARELDAEVASEVRQALLDHLVIFLRSQTATPVQQLAFAKKFCEPGEYA